MNIIILGAGRTGESVAQSLLSEENDITLVDADERRLVDLQARFDLRTVTGLCINPSVLEQAGARDADMLVACAPLDETNLVACKVARERFGIKTIIARLQSTEFGSGTAAMAAADFGIDQVICPEESVTRYIRRLIQYPEALQVLQFASGRVSLVAVRALDGAPMVGPPISRLPELLPNTDLRIVALYRRDATGGDAQIVCSGETRIEPGDEVFVLAATVDIRKVLDSLRRREAPVRRVIVAGGGWIGLRLARQIEHEVSLTLIERDAARAALLSTQLSSATLLLQGDATDGELLHAEGIGETDLYLGLTNDDEDNIMSALLAKRMGAKRVLALVNRREYADLVHGTAIDVAFAPSETIIGELLMHVRHADLRAVYSLRRGQSEALEAVVRGDRKSSRLVGRRVDEIKLPEGAQISAIVRGALDGPLQHDSRDDERGITRTIIARHDTRIESGDHVIAFLPRRRMVREFDKLLEVRGS